VRHAPPPLPPRQTPAPVAAPVVVAAAAPAVSNGAVKLAPAEVAALAFARAAGVHEPHVPTRQPAPVATAAAPPATATPSATNGHAAADVPAPATSAARRVEPASATPAARSVEPAPLRQPPPRRPVPPPRRSASPPPRREGSLRSAVVVGVIGVVLVALAVFVATNVLGGGSNKPARIAPNATATPAASQAARATPTVAALTKDNVKVAVYNGTGVSGLAGTLRDRLVTAGYKGKNGTGDYTPNSPPNAPLAVSEVMYQRGARTIARAVAQTLGIAAANVKQIDAAASAVAGKNWDVVVIAGADKSQ
jgi:LytR cell envelope-related transcriptional attenuator